MNSHSTQNIKANVETCHNSNQMKQITQELQSLTSEHVAVSQGLTQPYGANYSGDQNMIQSVRVLH